MRDPQVVRTPRVQKTSLWAIGTPVSAPPAPAAVPLGDPVRPAPLRQPGKRMRHGGDAGGIDALQGADEIQDLRQALLVHRDLGRREVEPRQGGDARDLFACEGHGGSRRAWRSEKTSAKSYMLPCSMSCRLLDYAPLSASPAAHSRSLHVQTPARLFFERSVDRSGYGEHPDLCARQGHC